MSVVAAALPVSRARVAGISLQNLKQDVRLAAKSGVVVADITTQSANSDPGFVITSQTPSGGCFADSLYTASPIVNLEFKNAIPRYRSYEVVRNPSDFVNNPHWIDFGSPQEQTCNGDTVYFQINLSYLQYFGPNLLGTSQLILFARFKDTVASDDQGNISAPAVSDSIVFGYPFIATQRGDVHTNSGILGAINGDASGTSSSQILCNPPSYSANADYIVSMTAGGIIQAISGVGQGSNCDNAGSSIQNDDKAETFRTRGYSQEGSSLVVNLPEPIPLDGMVPFSELEANATLKCPAIIPLNFTPQGGISDGSCQRVFPPGRNGEIVWLQSPDQGNNLINTDINNNAGLDANGIPDGSSVPLKNGAGPNNSGAITIFASEPNVNINIQSDFVYESGTTTITNLNQLASLSVFNKNGNITVRKSVQKLAGIFFAQNGTIETSPSSSQSPGKKKLSIYGSLIAKNIDFNRSWLGILP